MKRTLLTLLLSLAAIFSYGQKKIYTYELPVPRIIYENNAAILKSPSAINAGTTGNPQTLLYPFSIALPQGKKAAKVTIKYSGPVTIKLNAPLKPHTKPVPLETDADSTFFNEKTYSRSKLNLRGFSYRQGLLRGIRVVSGNFSPVVYYPRKNKIKFYTKARIKVTLQNTENQPPAFGATWLKQAIDNPQALKTYQLRQSSLDYLVITGQSLAAAVDTLAKFYRSKGYTVYVMTVEQIVRDFPGTDTAGKIRNAIKYLYQSAGLQTVLLAGDVDIVPARGFYGKVYSTGIYSSNNIPADIYYSGLDGNWNNDNDNKWAEPGEDDLLLDVAVGRLPFETPAEADNMISKVIRYQSSPVSSDLNRYFLIGEKLWNDPLTYGATYMNLLIGYQTDSGYVTQGIPPQARIDSLYDRQNVWTPDDLLQGINRGYNMIFHCGHSNSQYLMRLTIDDVTEANFAALDGQQHPNPVFYTHGCYAGAFDRNDCITEEFLKLPVFTSAVVANSRYGWFNEGQSDGPSEHLNREFVNAIFGLNNPVLGNAQLISKVRTAPFVDLPGEHEFGATRWVYYDCNLLGDPMQQVFTDTLKNWQIAFQDTVSQTDTVILQFADSLTVRASLWQDSLKCYETGFVRTGRLVFPPENTWFSDTLTIFLSAADRKDTVLNIIIRQSALPQIRLKSLPGSFSTDQSPALTTVLTNTGASTAYNLQITFSEATGILSSSSFAVNRLLPGQDTTANLFTEFLKSAPNNSLTNVTFTVSWKDADSNRYEYTIRKRVKILAPSIATTIDSTSWTTIENPDSLHIATINNQGSAAANLDITVSNEASVIYGKNINLSPGQSFNVYVKPAKQNSPVVRFDLEITRNINNLADTTYHFTIWKPMRQADMDFSQGVQGLVFDGQQWDTATAGYINRTSTITLVSPAIGDSEQTAAILNFYSQQTGYLAFEYNVSSQEGYDFFEAFLDDSLILKTSGNSGWKFFSIITGPGAHSLKFVYSKNDEGYNGRDNVLINRIFLPQGSSTFLPPSIQTIKIQPNPATDNILLVINSDSMAVVKITDLNGRQMIEINIRKAGIINISSLPPGIYIVTVNINGQMYRNKLVKL